MRFDPYLPCDALKPYVKSFVISENPEESTYKVLPDTGVVIGFQYKGHQISLDTSGLTGLQDSFRLFTNSSDTGSVLVYFKEAGATPFFRQPIHELFRESVSLDNFLLRSELLILEEQLCEAQTDTAKVEVVEQFLITRLKHPTADNLVLAALSLIHKTKGTVRIKDLLEQLHTSQSPLEKRFRQAVGTSPKKFASIVRFKHTLQTFNPQQSLTELGYEAGFYDQAHFIKEFKNFTGETPESFFNSI
jgi:AraC-like DNA-binding protein